MRQKPIVGHRANKLQDETLHTKQRIEFECLWNIFQAKKQINAFTFHVENPAAESTLSPCLSGHSVVHLQCEDYHSIIHIIHSHSLYIIEHRVICPNNR